MKRFVVGVLIGFVFGMTAGLVPWIRSSDFAVYAVSRDRPDLLHLYFLVGGNANQLTAEGSLAYVATGPNGGNAVLAILLRHGADPNRGIGRNTPLMNAASWCYVDGLRLLIAAHADPSLKNERGKTAIDMVCSAPQDLAIAAKHYLGGAVISNNPGH
jgi:ankyrin repeat protein